MKDDRSDEKKYLQGVSMSRRSFINTAALIGMAHFKGPLLRARLRLPAFQLYSINLHRGDQSRSAIKTQLAAIKDLKKSGENEITLTLDSGNADLPFLLADYHLVVVPDGFTDWKHPIGTGGFANTKPPVPIGCF